MFSVLIHIFFSKYIDSNLKEKERNIYQFSLFILYFILYIYQLPNIYFLDKIHSLYQFLNIVLNFLRGISAKAKAVPIVLT